MLVFRRVEISQNLLRLVFFLRLEDYLQNGMDQGAMPPLGGRVGVNISLRG